MSNLVKYQISLLVYNTISNLKIFFILYAKSFLFYIVCFTKKNYEEMFFMKKLHLIYALFLLTVLFMFSGCATTVVAKVKRPAEIDIPGAKSVSVLSFKTEKTNDIWAFFSTFFEEERETDRIARFLSDELNDLFIEDDYYSLIEPRTVKKAIDNGNEIPCDVYVTGYIEYYDSDIEKRKRSKKDDEGNEKVWYEFYRRVSCRIVYQIVESKTNKILYINSRELRATSGDYDSRYSVPSGDRLLESDLRSFAKSIVRKMQPYYENVTFTLLSDKTKDPAMKYANELAKKSYISESCDAFLDLYDQKGYMEAGYNAAMLLYALGDYYYARDLMQEIADVYHSSKAMDRVHEINKDIEKNERLKAQLESRD